MHAPKNRITARKILRQTCSSSYVNTVSQTCDAILFIINHHMQQERSKKELRKLPFGCRRRLHGDIHRQKQTQQVRNAPLKESRIGMIIEPKKQKGTGMIMEKYLSMDISLQKSSMFSAVRSCSKRTLIATSVPFQMPRNTSPKKPMYKKRSL